MRQVFFLYHEYESYFSRSGNNHIFLFDPHSA